MPVVTGAIGMRYLTGILPLEVLVARRRNLAITFQQIDPVSSFSALLPSVSTQLFSHPGIVRLVSIESMQLTRRDHPPYLSAWRLCTGPREPRHGCSPFASRPNDSCKSAGLGGPRPVSDNSSTTRVTASVVAVMILRRAISEVRTCLPFLRLNQISKSNNQNNHNQTCDDVK